MLVADGERLAEPREVVSLRLVLVFLRKEIAKVPPSRSRCHPAPRSLNGSASLNDWTSEPGFSPYFGGMVEVAKGY